MNFAQCCSFNDYIFSINQSPIEEYSQQSGDGNIPKSLEVPQGLFRAEIARKNNEKNNNLQNNWYKLKLHSDTATQCPWFFKAKQK